MVRHAVLADALIFSMHTHIQIGTPVFSGVPSRGLKNVQPKKVYSAHSEYLSRSMLHVSLHDNLLLSQILTLAESHFRWILFAGIQTNDNPYLEYILPQEWPFI